MGDIWKLAGYRHLTLDSIFAQDGRPKANTNSNITKARAGKHRYSSRGLGRAKIYLKNSSAACVPPPMLATTQNKKDITFSKHPGAIHLCTPVPS
jgi:hypothetical protein